MRVIGTLLKDLYTGHFYIAEANNYSDINHICTRHFIEGPCTWILHGKSIFYWNEIYLESRGNFTNNHGFSYSQLWELWSVANATKENMMMYLWVPGSIISKYVGSVFKICTCDSSSGNWNMHCTPIHFRYILSAQIKKSWHNSSNSQFSSGFPSEMDL